MTDESRRPTRRNEVVSVLNGAQVVVFVAMVASVIAGLVLALYELEDTRVYLGDAFVLMGLALIVGPLAFAVLRYLIWRAERAERD